MKLVRWSLLGLFAAGMVGAAAQSATLPIEVMGPEGTAQVVTFTMPASPAGATAPVSLVMKFHNLSYEGKASVRINSGVEHVLTNDYPGLVIAEPGKAYGGMGSSYAILQLTLPLAAAEVPVVGGTVTVAFKFKLTNGVSSGFRVLDFNFLDQHGIRLLPDNFFPQDNPAAWAAPAGYATSTSINLGKAAFQARDSLYANPAGTKPIHASCADCHTIDGRDLQYFGYSNYSIEARAGFHRLTETTGKQIAAYIRSIAGGSPGRPWNPPYQPGPGMDFNPADPQHVDISQWAAGSGLVRVLPQDKHAMYSIFPNGITSENVAATGDLDMRLLPTDFLLLDWNHWLPRVHPLDSTFFGAEFTNSPVNKYYNGDGNGVGDSVRAALITNSVHWPAYWTHWHEQSETFFAAHNGTNTDWTPEYSRDLYSVALWRQVKRWELMTEFHLETLYATNAETATWFDGDSFMASPTRRKIPMGDGTTNGVSVTPADYEYINNGWYYLQAVLDAGRRQMHGNDPIDWPYSRGRVVGLQAYSTMAESGDEAVTNGVPEGMRLYSLLVKGMQQNDGLFQHGPGTNPDDGWNPEKTSNVSMLVSPNYEDAWLGWDPNLKKQAIEALTRAWFSKMQSYSVADYSTDAAGMAGSSLVQGNNMNGGPLIDQVYCMIPFMRKLGVDGQMLNSIAAWGARMWPNAANHWTAVPWTLKDGASYAYTAGGVTTTLYGDAYDGMVGRWKFDEEYGTRVVDWSDSGLLVAGSNPGTLTGASGAGIPGWVASGAAVGGGAVTIGTADQWVEIPRVAKLDVSGSFSVSAWIRLNDTGSPKFLPIIGTKNVWSDAAGYTVSYNPSGHKLSMNGAGSLMAQATATLDGGWHHIAFTDTAGTARFYVDGAPVATTPAPIGTVVPSSHPIQIGRAFNGQLDDVRLYNRALDDDDVENIYKATKVTP